MQKKIKQIKVFIEMIKRIIKIIAIIALVFLLYLLLGIVLSYAKQPVISQEYQSSFCAMDCYGDAVSVDRAYIIEDNETALEERLHMIEQAQDRVILSTFEFRSDESGKDILAALLQAAQRGVDIKILADGTTAFMRMDRNEYFYALASMENVEIKIYNSINVLMPWKSMGRLHDKYVIVDDDLYLLGGRNTYDYFLGDYGYKNYDREVLVYSTKPDQKESSIHQLEAYFASVWDLEVCTPFEGRNTKKTLAAREELQERYEKIKRTYPNIAEAVDYEAKTFAVNKITLLSNPTHVYTKEPTVFYALAEIMRQSEGDIAIHTPYIICNDWMYDSFREICDKNPDTVLLTNSAANNGNPFGAVDYLENKHKLVDTGLNIYEYEGGVSYHGKSLSVGNRLSIIGSFNMDLRSTYLDTELMLVIDSEAVNRQLRENMRMYEAESVKVLDTENYEIPKGVTRQEISADKKWKIMILKPFRCFRFLI